MEEELFSFDNFEEGTENDRWNELLDKIFQHDAIPDVIPVIGPNLLTDSNEQPYQQLINLFANQFGADSKPETFSQLIYDETFKRGMKAKKLNIYSLIHSVLGRVSQMNAKTLPVKTRNGTVELTLEPSDLIVRLLETKKFPFVITTSFTDHVERAMRKIYGDVRVLEFINNPDNDQRVDKCDIQSEADLRKPTVFYMFGKYSNKPHSYVVSDMDMMKFCKTWISGFGIPRVLADCIRNRFLLFLGTDYSDWLFRFVWFSMRNSNGNIMTSNDYSATSSMYVGDIKEKPLEQFLDRLQVSVQKSPVETIEDIIKHINDRAAKEPTAGTTADETSDEESYDVFISYSRTNIDIAHILYDALSSKGLKVWVDNLGGIDYGENWRQAIYKGIKESCIFIPLLTKNIEREINKEHEYRTEWERADERCRSMGNIPYILPVVEEGFDFYNDSTGIPDSFKESNALKYVSADDLRSKADEVVKVVNKSKELEKEIG